MKGHDRPYGCTFPTCSDMFTRKCGWTRHENVQHFQNFQNEFWRCEEVNPKGGTCAMEFELRHSYQEHLHSSRRILNPDVVKKKINSTCIFSNDQGIFGAGFVRSSLIWRRKAEGETERFDHIDNHFMGCHGLVRLQQGI
jgi:hypothetical protein